MLVQLDWWLFHLVNGRMGGLELDLLDEVFLDLSAFGAWTIALVLLAMLSREKWRDFQRHFLALFLASLVLIPVYTGLKEWVDRDRPAKAFSGAVDTGDIQARFIERHVLRHHSFPSGHTAFAFFCMFYAGMYQRNWRPWGLLVAGLVGVARVYVGAHFPLDCLTGGVLGVLGGWLAWKLFLLLERKARQAKT